MTYDSIAILVVGLMFWCIYVAKSLSTVNENGDVVPLNSMMVMILYSFSAFTAFMSLTLILGIAEANSYGELVKSSLRGMLQLGHGLSYLILFVLMLGVIINVGWKAADWIGKYFGGRKS